LRQSAGGDYFQLALDIKSILTMIHTQVGLGLPASSPAAGSGYVSPSLVNNALDCLAARANCGSFVPAAAYLGIRGVMTWSINGDASNGDNFADTVAPYLATLP